MTDTPTPAKPAPPCEHLTVERLGRSRQSLILKCPGCAAVFVARKAA